MIEGIKIVDYLQRKKNYQKHMNRLQLITQRKHSQNKQPYQRNFHLLKQKSRRIKTEDFNKSVQEGNKKLLQRIVDISTRASQTSFRKTYYKSKAHHHSYYSRAKDYDAINQQNPCIMKRIASQTGCISSEQQQKQYHESQKLKQQIQKFPYIKNIKRKIKAIQTINLKKLIPTQRNNEVSRYSQNVHYFQDVNQIIV